MFETYNLGDLGDTPYGLAIGAGCSSEGARIAAAVAQAESGGNARAHNPTPPDDSYGLWQINMLARLGPERRAQFGLTSNDQLYDPQTNARAMFAISGGCQNFNPWTTFTHGTYRRYLSAAAPADLPSGSGDSSGGGPSGDDDDSGDSTGGGFETFTSPVDFFSGAPAWLPIAALAIAAYFIMK